MKKIITLLLMGLLTVSFTSPSYAQSKNSPLFQRERERIREIIEEGKESSLPPKEIRQRVREEIKNQIQEKRENLFEKAKKFLKRLRYEARVRGKISQKAEGEIKVVDIENHLYTVKITDKTRLIRRWGGRSNLEEFAVGDEVNVIGRWADEQKTTIEAVLIRNLSIQKRFGVFFGKVIEKKDDYFVIATIARGNQKVYVNSTTKFLDHKKNPINYSDLKIGDRVRVKGVWDRTLSEIRETEEVRVFPPAPQPTITP